MTPNSRVVFLGAVWLLSISALQGVAQESDLQAKIQARVEELRSKAGFPGMTAAVALPDGQVLTAAAGWADAERHIPMKPTDRMLAGSVGKTFVVAVILQAVDEGQLDLDSPIARWIGREPWFTRIPNARSLTLRLLLSHRSGIPDHADSRSFAKTLTRDLDKYWTPLELVSFVFDKKPRFPAGRKFYYADMNYILAGLVFEAATGRSLFAEVERRILKPFGLDQTVPTESRDWTHLVPGQLDPKNPLDVKGETIQNGRFMYNAQAEYAGGGIISTSGDLARWAKLLWEGQVFSHPQLEQMLKGQPAEGAEYGLGVEILPAGSGSAYGHDGWIPGYQSVVMYFPEYKIAVALQVNSDPSRRFKMEIGDCLGPLVGLVLREKFSDRLPAKGKKAK